MKKSTSITLGLVLAAGVSFACGSGGDDDDPVTSTEPADHQKICVTITDQGQQMERRPDEECAHQPDDNGISSENGGSFVCIICWYYLGRAYGSAPAVGSKIPISATGRFSKPITGSIATPPRTGGFGMHTSTVAT